MILTNSFVILMFFVVFSGPAFSEELFTHKNIRISLQEEGRCQADTPVRLDVSSEEAIRKSRIDMQELSDMVKTYVWLDCDKVESLSYEGYIEGKDEVIYRATAKKDGQWFLEEKDPNTPPLKKTLENKATPPTTQTSSLEKKSDKAAKKQAQLEDAATQGSVKAMIALAKGLLDLSGADPKIKFTHDTKRGMKLLEELALQGNQDAKHLLGEAYQADSSQKVNLSLLNKITQELPEDPAKQRGRVAGQLTIEAAAKGGHEAIKALNEAGQSGSGVAYYALALMYLFDKQEEMPTEKGFLEGELELELQDPGPGGVGNSDVGQHFLRLAAQRGNSEAQKVLSDLDEKVGASAQESQRSSLQSALAESIESMGNAQVDQTVKTAQAKASDPSASSSPSGEPASSPSSTVAQTGAAPEPQSAGQSGGNSGGQVGTSSVGVDQTGNKKGGFNQQTMQSRQEIGWDRSQQETQRKPVEIVD